MAELLNKKRGSIKARLTTFEKYFNLFEASFAAEVSESEHAISDAKFVELKQRIDRAEKLIVEFDNVQCEIECAAENPEEHYNEREEFETKFYSIISKAKSLFSKLEQKIKQEVATELGLNSSVQHNQSNEGTQSNSFQHDRVKLPTIKLPKFNGSYENWMEFRDVFDSLIHANEQISNTSKFQYLRASLEGNASQVIKSIQVTADNYDLAWNLLCERFDNKRLLVQNHVKALFNLEIITRESSSKLRNLSDDFSKHLRSLKQLGEQVDSWDTLMIYIVASKLDSVTTKEWEKHKSDLTDTPTLQDLKKFLKNRADLLETVETNSHEKRFVKKEQTRGLFTKQPTYTNTCAFCKKDHAIYHCQEFLRLTVNDRMSKARELKLCNNYCLKAKHLAKDCRSSGCQKCRGRHNTLLHEDVTSKVDNETRNNATSENTSHNDQDATSTSLSMSMFTKNVLLSTAVVRVKDSKSNIHTARALLDSGSQSSFITEELIGKLNLRKIDTKLLVCGLNNSTSNINYKCELILYSGCNDFSINMSCYVIKQITGSLPDVKINPEHMKIPANISLADPKFYIPEKIDILVGADIFWKLLCVGQLSLGPECPILQKTRLGWIVAGPLNNLTISQKTVCHFHKGLEMQLAKFWEVEEIETKKPHSIEEELCEKHFCDTFTRDESGIFIVSMPFKNDIETIGDSRNLATKRFYQLEKKLQGDKNLRELYIDFLREYESLGHMTESKNENTSRVEYYMPHHGVLRETSLTTKLRVVFNASAPSSTGTSLNDIQMTGPIIQNDLLSIILRFRTHAVILSSDIKMMYRQVLIKPEERDLQKIIWRENQTDELRTYKLNTVTYGVKSASFLAIRCVQELANECKDTQPEISEIISTDMYVDDLLTGTDTPENAKVLCETISKILSSGGFELRKWKSNIPSAISEVKNIDPTTNIFEFSINKEQNYKTLGLTWICDTDELVYNIKPNTDLPKVKINKRAILSQIATIFDPLGLLSPSIIKAKILLQKLWAEKLTWDESLPIHIHHEWCEFQSELNYLNDLKISRRVLCDNPVSIELHGFSDAAESAYGGCIHLKSINANNECTVELLCAKSKVAPLKQLTMPRLELCGALTLARLYDKVTRSLRIQIDRVVFWSDSTIILGWLQTSPSLLKPFVDNRVGEIQRLTDPNLWRHVPTKDNPADLVSRGVSPKNIINAKIWWNGPIWLKDDENSWPILKLRLNDSDLPEMRKQKVTAVVRNETSFPFQRFSNLLRLKRSMAYILRFIDNCRKTKNERNVSPLSVEEIERAFQILIKIAQKQSFATDYFRLLNKKPINSDSKILSLNPFLDANNIIRVGGRLKNSNFPYNKKHPILVSPKHDLTRLIFEYEHKNLLHGGPQLLLSQVRETFWPIAGRNLSRKVVRSCVKCARFSSNAIQPIMGNLPASRLQPAPPFATTGVDYAGPFLLKDKRGRGNKITKCWICLFVCFVTRAIHLELVSSLTSQAFIQVLRRFISRRGKPTDAYSDNGTNFVGAMKELGGFIGGNFTEITEMATNLNIKWHFIPTSSPHFGGIWEAGVKATKYHLKRVLGNVSLTYEDFSTLLAQIEAALNSRPLSPLLSDPQDLNSLTPAHFLVGRPLTTIPEPDYQMVPENRLSHYQHLQSLNQQFWNRWSREYVAELQRRTKWQRNQGQLAVGQLVLIKESNVPPMRWHMGRVVEIFPGNDNISRVASIKTASGIILEDMSTSRV